jgi:S-(hydroxymethyl)glutathione dehydrogenase/alcohol dehydrogenase
LASEISHLHQHVFKFSSPNLKKKKLLLFSITGEAFGVTDFVNPTQIDKSSVSEVGVSLNPTSSCGCMYPVGFVTNLLVFPFPVQLQVISEMTGGGVDYSFECVGLPSVMTDAFRSTRTVRFLLLYPC